MMPDAGDIVGRVVRATRAVGERAAERVGLTKQGREKPAASSAGTPDKSPAKKAPAKKAPAKKVAAAKKAVPAKKAAAAKKGSPAKKGAVKESSAKVEAANPAPKPAKK